MGRCKSLGLLKSFLLYTSQISGASILVFFIPKAPQLTVGSGCSLMAATSQASFFLGPLWAQKLTFGGLELLIAVTSLFIDMVGNSPFLTNYQRNADQNYNEVSPHTGQNSHHQKYLWTINAGEGMKKREPSCSVNGNVSWYSHYGERYGGSLKT